MANQRKFYRLFRHSSKGFSLIEVLIALAILGLVAAAFLGGLATASKAMFIADKRTTAESLARSQMEYVKNQDYDAINDPPVYAKLLDIPDGFNIDDITAFRLDPNDNGTENDDGIQKIIVTVRLDTSEVIILLEDYKVNR